MLCLDTFIPSGALDNIPHTINKTMDIPTFLRRSREMIVRLRNTTAGRRGRQNACVWQTWQGYNLCVMLFLWSLQKNLLKARKVKFGEKLFQTLYYYMRNFCNLIGLEQRYFSLIWNTYMWNTRRNEIICYRILNYVMFSSLCAITTEHDLHFKTTTKNREFFLVLSDYELQSVSFSTAWVRLTTWANMNRGSLALVSALRFHLSFFL